MSHTLATPPPPATARRWLARVWDDPDSRSTTIGLAGVLLIHLLLWLLGPHVLQFESIATVGRHDPTARQFNIELAPDTVVQPQPKPADPSRFVEANPDAPDNTPDKTTNFSDRNQQVAQETPTPDGKSDRPALEGKKDFESNQIVSGRLTNPLENMEPVPPSEFTPAQPTVTAPRAEQNPLPGFEKKEGENKDSFGTNIARIPDNARPVPERVEGAKDVPLIEGATGLQPAIDPKRPRPRPQVVRQQQVRPAILAENKFGTKNIGNIAVDARWSSYGEYLRRMIDVVQTQWEGILMQTRLFPPPGSSVTVKFILNSEGLIAQIVDVEHNSTQSAVDACINGITARVPYDHWTDDMKAVLGEQQEMTFTFYYQ